MTTQYIALLRAINVAGTGIITMEETRRIFASLGFEDISTLGASGNVIFSAQGAASTHRRKIEGALSARLGKPATAILRSAAEMNSVVEGTPFLDAVDAKRYVAFLSEPVGRRMPGRMPGFDIEFPTPRESEVYIVVAKTVPPGADVGKFIEKTLGKVPATLRNWNVVQKLAGKMD